MKTELEEAAEKYSYGGREGGHRTPFLDGVKWQQERSYSEEEVHNIIQIYSIEGYDIGQNITYDEWFEQFKKK